MATFSRTLHVDKPWNILFTNPIYGVYLCPPLHFCVSCLIPPLIPAPENLASYRSPHCAHRHDWQRECDAPI